MNKKKVIIINFTLDNFQVDIFEVMRGVVKKTFPPKVRKAPTHSLKQKKTLAKQEQLKREVQSMKSKGNATK